MLRFEELTRCLISPAPQLQGLRLARISGLLDNVGPNLVAGTKKERNISREIFRSLLYKPASPNIPPSSSSVIVSGSLPAGNCTHLTSRSAAMR